MSKDVEDTLLCFLPSEKSMDWIVLTSVHDREVQGKGIKYIPPFQVVKHLQVKYLLVGEPVAFKDAKFY